MIEFETMMGEEANKVDPEGFKWPWDTLVLWAKENGEIVGRTTAMNLTVVEGTWCAEKYRGGTLAYRLLRQLEEIMAAPPISKTASLAMIADAQLELGDYMRRVGYERVPVTFYVKSLVKKSEAA
jgi:hypothetical protein